MYSFILFQYADLLGLKIVNIGGKNIWRRSSHVKNSSSISPMTPCPSRGDSWVSQMALSKQPLPSIPKLNNMFSTYSYRNALSPPWIRLGSVSGSGMNLLLRPKIELPRTELSWGIKPNGFLLSVNPMASKWTANKIYCRNDWFCSYVWMGLILSCWCQLQLVDTWVRRHKYKSDIIKILFYLKTGRARVGVRTSWEPGGITNLFSSVKNTNLLSRWWGSWDILHSSSSCSSSWVKEVNTDNEDIKILINKHKTNLIQCGLLKLEVDYGSWWHVRILFGFVKMKARFQEFVYQIDI